MPDIVGVRFKNCGRIYDFDSSGLEIVAGDRVIVESELGVSIGRVIIAPHAVTDEKEYKKVLRMATEDDLKQKQDNEPFEKEAREYCLERIMARGLPMKLVCSEVTLDRKRILFYFTADGRIDFRELVKDLAAKFRTRIEMRQIGVRDKAKLIGGLGICGRELCCRLFLTSFEPISIKMAKQQELVLNTGKLSGTCGRLMCCLGYEYNTGVSDVASPPSEAVEAEVEDEEVISADEVSGPEAEAIPVTAAATSEQEKVPEGQTPQDQNRSKRHKRRRRHRHRHKKKEAGGEVKSE